MSDPFGTEGKRLSFVQNWGSNLRDFQLFFIFFKENEPQVFQGANIFNVV
jgi:hypothetical protein